MRIAFDEDPLRRKIPEGDNLPGQEHETKNRREGHHSPEEVIGASFEGPPRRVYRQTTDEYHSGVQPEDARHHERNPIAKTVLASPLEPKNVCAGQRYEQHQDAHQPRPHTDPVLLGLVVVAVWAARPAVSLEPITAERTNARACFYRLNGSYCRSHLLLPIRNSLAARLRDCGIGLHYEIRLSARHAVLIRSVMHHRLVPSEVVMGRRRRNSPLERSRFPRIYDRLLALIHTPNEVREEQYLNRGGEECRIRDELRNGHYPFKKFKAFAGNFIPMERVSSRRSGDSHDVHRNEDRVYADECKPEMHLADPFAHHPAEHLREPVVGSGEHTEDRRHSHNHVKVADYEVRIVQLKIERSLAEEHSGNAAGDEQRYEAYREQHRGSEANSRAPQRSKPVEGLDRGWNSDSEGDQREHHTGPRVHSADKHMMAPHDEAKEPDREYRVHHRAISKNRLSRERRKDVRRCAHAGQDRDIDFRMSKEPEQVLSYVRRAASVFSY